MFVRPSGHSMSSSIDIFFGRMSVVAQPTGQPLGSSIFTESRKMEKTKIDTFFIALDLEYFKVKYLH